MNIIAVFGMMFTLQMAIVGIVNIREKGINYFLKSDFLYIIFFFTYLLFDIWILTATFLPIIKINNKGIFAYSMFWKRQIKWEEIQSAKLIKMENRRVGGRYGRASVSFELTEKPEKKSNALLNKGVRVNTYIIISKTTFKKPVPLSLGGQLLTHNKMTTGQEIAFEYEQKAWQIIKEKINR